jgi:hypothetical protein
LAAVSECSATTSRRNSASELTANDLIGGAAARPSVSIRTTGVRRAGGFFMPAQPGRGA